MKRWAVWCVAFGLSACGGGNLGEYPRGPLAVEPAPELAGWMHVDEPGWFSASLPSSPRTSFETIALSRTHLQVKALSATDQQNLFVWVRYFEVSQLTTMLDPAALLQAGRDDFLAIPGVSFTRDEPRRPGGPNFDFVCAIAPGSPLNLSDAPMVARVRAYGRAGTSARATFAIAVWPAGGSDEPARAFFDSFRVKG